MTSKESVTLKGSCTCGSIQFELTSLPMFIHCCHCTWCQRETGSAFALNALIEADRVVLKSGSVEAVPLPSASGKGQVVWRCPKCKVATWSNYAGAGDQVHFVRIGTLIHSQLKPDVHIFTSTKKPWVILDASTPSFEVYYRPKEIWPKESQLRWKKVMEKSKNR